MKSKEEFLQTVRDKAEKYEAERRRRNRVIRNFSLLLAICLAVSLTAYLGRDLIDFGDIPTQAGEVASTETTLPADGNTQSPVETGLTEAGSGSTKDENTNTSALATSTPTEAMGTTAAHTTAAYTTGAMETTAAEHTHGTHSTTTTTAPTSLETDIRIVYDLEIESENFSEHMELMPDRKTLENRLGRTVDMTPFTDEFYATNVVYALWVKNDRRLRFGGVAKINGESFIGLDNAYEFSGTGNHLVLVAVPKLQERLAGCTTPDGRVILEGVK